MVMDVAAGYENRWESTGSPGRQHNLPTQLTSFVGRRREVAEVRRLLHSARLVTLTGVGGVGKSPCFRCWSRHPAACRC